MEALLSSEKANTPGSSQKEEDSVIPIELQELEDWSIVSLLAMSSEIVLAPCSPVTVQPLRERITSHGRASSTCGSKQENLPQHVEPTRSTSDIQDTEDCAFSGLDDTLKSVASSTSFTHSSTSSDNEKPNYISNEDKTSQPPELFSKVKAVSSYKASKQIELSFKKGDVMEIVGETNDDQWYLVKHRDHLKEGYIPKKCVQTLPPGAIENHCCFYQIDRNKAKIALDKDDVEIGTYLMRPCSDGVSYVVSYLWSGRTRDDKVRHIRFTVPDLEIYVDNSKFQSIEELVDSYSYLQRPYLSAFGKLLENEVNFSKLKFGRKLGGKKCSTVTNAMLHDGYKTMEVAVKTLNPNGQMSVEDFLKGAETMHLLRHPRIVSLIGISVCRDVVYLIMEKVKNGCLRDLLRQDAEKRVQEIKFSSLIKMAIQIVEGMLHLGKESFVHRDLRAANILIGEDYNVKISEFGFARLLNTRCGDEKTFQDGEEKAYQANKEMAFHHKWMAPEAATYRRFTVKSDVWAFGVLLYEIVTYGAEPYHAMTSYEVISWLDEGNRMKKPTKFYCPDSLYNIMELCWLENPQERPTFEDIRESLEGILSQAAK